MIALDSSAIVAIILAEPEAAALVQRMASADILLIGTPTEVETRMVLTARGDASPADRALLRVLGQPHIRRIDFTQQHAAAATDAFLRFGKGRHPAGLNYGDCMAYAIAAVAGCPLLYKGDDFARTDIRPAL